MRILRRADYRPMPWKNAGGTTWEIAREPLPPAAFQWRLSMARIESNGPFSDFSGYERVMVLLSGAGLRLKSPGATDRSLRRPGDWLRFDGGQPIECELAAGPCIDLNLMVDRQFSLEVSVDSLTRSRQLGADAGELLIVLPIEGTCTVKGSVVTSLPALDALLVDGGEHVDLSPSRPAPAHHEVFIARLARR